MFKYLFGSTIISSFFLLIILIYFLIYTIKINNLIAYQKKYLFNKQAKSKTVKIKNQINPLNQKQVKFFYRIFVDYKRTETILSLQTKYKLNYDIENETIFRDYRAMKINNRIKI